MKVIKCESLRNLSSEDLSGFHLPLVEVPRYSSSLGSLVQSSFREGRSHCILHVLCFGVALGDFLPKQCPMVVVNGVTSTTVRKVACELVERCENRQGIYLDLDSASGGHTMMVTAFKIRRFCIWVEIDSSRGYGCHWFASLIRLTLMLSRN